MYLESEVFKVDQFVSPARLVVYRVSVVDYLECLGGKLDLAKAYLERLGAMHGHHAMPINQAMKEILGDLKSPWIFRPQNPSPPFQPS